jgi:hypothetical protein
MNGILIYHIYGIIMGYEWDTQTVWDLDVFQWDLMGFTNQQWWTMGIPSDNWT